MASAGAAARRRRAPGRRRGDAGPRAASWCSRGSIRRSPAKSKARSRRRATSSSATRRTTGWKPDVPLLIPEINADHLALLEAQAAARGWKGRIVTNPNCSTVVLSMALAPLRQFGLKSVMITTLQAISGAGYPGVAVVGHPRQRDPVHRRRRAQDRDRDEEDSRLLRRQARRAASGDGQRDDHARGGAGRAHRVDFGRRSTNRPTARGDHRRVQLVQGQAAGARPAVGAGAAGGLPDRAQPAAAGARRRSRPRHDGHASDGCVRARCSTTSSSRSATTRFAAPPARRSSTPS